MTRKLTISMVAVAAATAAALPGAASAAIVDRNHDLIPDGWEVAHHLTLRAHQTNLDADHDGLTNRAEYLSHTNPRLADTNHNRITDANEDPDHDGVDNANEYREHTSPFLRDSNRNRVLDGNEDADHDGLNNRGEDYVGDDPIDPDTDDDGINDGAENGGRIASFDASTGLLTITLSAGGSVSATVDAQTEIECDTEDQPVGTPAPTARKADTGGGDEGDDDQGDSADDQGDDDQGDSADDQGDDDQGDTGDTGGDDDGNGDGGTPCTTADLVPGAAVHEAELTTTSTGSVWTQVEIVK